MKTTSVVAAFLAVAGVVEAQTYRYTAIPWYDLNVGNNRNPPQRKDIENLSYEERTLFVLAMRQWQTTSRTTDVGGYHQVCGIHGAPHAYWDVDPGTANPQRTGQGYWDMGYCFHNTHVFYHWHRPYLALFEQQLRNIAVTIANGNSWGSASSKAVYQAAAQNLRLPYWDWAKGSNPGVVPSSIAQSTISIGNPSGGSQTISNPLYSHTLVTGRDAVLDYTYFGNRPITLGRAPNRGVTWRSPTYQNDMRNQGAQLQKWTAQLLNTAISCWNTFVTYDTNERSQCRGSQPSVQSLEGIHNTVHNTVCGTMCNLDTAAFDPIFWLHHCNVDRIGAIFQYLNPNTRTQTGVTSGGNWVWNAGVSRSNTFQLMPFRWEDRNTAGSWWQPRWLDDERNSGYTYPELAGRPSAATVRQAVQRLYGNGFTQLSVASGASSKRVKRSDRRAILEYRQAVSENPANLTVPPPASALAPIADTLLKPNRSFDEYDVYVKIDKSVSPGKSFNFHCFFGNPGRGKKTHSDYLAAPNRAGGFAISVAQSAAGNPNMMGSTIADGIVPITDGLLHMVLIGNIQDMDPKRVRRYIRSKLVYRIVDLDGKDLTSYARSKKLVKIRINHSVVTPSGEDPNARPIVAAPDSLIDTTDQSNSASALPSGVAATTVATAPGSAETGAGPVPITGDGKGAQA